MSDRGILAAPVRVERLQSVPCGLGRLGAVDVGWLNENDGEATFELLVNGSVVDSWIGLGGSGPRGALETRQIAVSLNTGDTIALRGVQKYGEYARFDAISIVEELAQPTVNVIGADHFDFF